MTRKWNLILVGLVLSGCKLGSTTTTRVTYPAAWTEVEGTYRVGSSESSTRQASLCTVVDASGDIPCWTLVDETLLPEALRAWTGLTGTAPEVAARQRAQLESTSNSGIFIKLAWIDMQSGIFGLSPLVDSSEQTSQNLIASQFQDAQRANFVSRSSTASSSRSTTNSSNNFLFEDDPNCGLSLRLDTQGKRSYQPATVRLAQSEERVTGQLTLTLEATLSLGGNCTEALTRVLNCVAYEDQCATQLSISNARADWIRSWFTAPVLALLNDFPQLQVLAYAWTFE